MAILVGLVLPKAATALRDQLESAAHTIAADLAYARSLAVTNGSPYRVTFNFQDNSYVLEHSGSDATLETLPSSPFRDPNDPSDKYIVRLDSFPHLGAPVHIAAMATYGSTIAPTHCLEFTPLGETTAAGFTLIWLEAGAETARRYYVLAVNPVTGVALADPRLGFTATAPPAEAMP